MIDILIWFGILAIVLVVVWWLSSRLNIPEPIRQILLIVAVIVVAIVGITLLLSLTGSGPPLRLRL